MHVVMGGGVAFHPLNNGGGEGGGGTGLSWPKACGASEHPLKTGLQSGRTGTSPTPHASSAAAPPLCPSPSRVFTARPATRASERRVRRLGCRGCPGVWAVGDFAIRLTGGLGRWGGGGGGAARRCVPQALPRGRGWGMGGAWGGVGAGASAARCASRRTGAALFGGVAARPLSGGWGACALDVGSRLGVLGSARAGPAGVCGGDEGSSLRGGGGGWCTVQRWAVWYAATECAGGGMGREGRPALKMSLIVVTRTRVGA